MNYSIIENILALVTTRVLSPDSVSTACVNWLGDNGLAEMVNNQYDMAELNRSYRINTVDDMLNALEHGQIDHLTATDVILRWIGTDKVHGMVSELAEFDGLTEILGVEK